MKRTLLFSVSIFALLIGVLSLTVWNGKANASKASKGTNVAVSVSPTKTHYVLGEIVGLGIDITNRGDEPVFLRGWDARSGFIRLSISSDGTNFSEYANSAWMGGKQQGRNLIPGEALHSDATILWNSKPDTSHLSESAARLASQGRILSDYAFSRPGTYYLKATLIIPGLKQIRVESDAVQITLDSPVGDDLKAWNDIKDDGDIAFFIQEGEFRNPDEKGEVNTKLKERVNQLIQAYPTSVYAQFLQKSVEKHNASEARRREFMEKLRKENQN